MMTITSTDEVGEVLANIEHAVMAILMLLVEQAQLDDAKSRTDPRSVDQLLFKAGFAQSEIADILGKTPQAVSARLKRDGVT